MPIGTITMSSLLTLRSSDDRNPPIHIKHLSAGVFHIPDKMWKTSAFEAMPLSLKISSKCDVTLSTIVRSSVSPACELTAALSSTICLLCSSSQREYSTSNAAAPADHPGVSNIITILLWRCVSAVVILAYNYQANQDHKLRKNH